MKRWSKITALALALMLLLLATGCEVLGFKKPTEQAAGGNEPIAIATEAPEDVQPETLPGATAEPVPTPAVDDTVTAQFAALDKEVFCWYATTDGFSFHALIDDPAAFGIDRASVPMTLGEFTEEDSKVYAAEAAGYLERLSAIPRSGLSQTDQLSYDVMEQYLTDAADDTDYEYFYEPLTEYSGLHAALPQSFMLFEIDNEQDVQDYLALFADLPRYLEQVLAYEQKRAELNMFMTEDALDAILDACDDIIDSKDNSFLYATFSDAVNALPELTNEQKQAYIEQNNALVKKDYINAYRKLYKGLDALRRKCSVATGMGDRLGEKGRAYFETCMQGEADNLLSVEETLELLTDEMYNLLVSSAMIMDANPDALTHTENITSGNTQTDLELLKGITASILPALPAHEVVVSDVPEELQSMMSPAAYVIPALDGWEKNEVLINPANEDSTLLFTLAHEAYPGHMYQYIYQRGLSRLGLTQRALHYGGYAEGWSQLAEYLVMKNQNTYDKDYAELVFNQNIVINALMPAIVSIYVNYQGYSESAVKLKLDVYWPTLSEQLAKSYYKLAVEQPFYTLCYGVGFAQLMGMLRDAETTLGDDFDQKAFLTAYLDLGPGYFNLIQERMDVWVDAQIREAISEGV